MEPTYKKPKWLRRLEEESWQAELVISGLAIYGALQLPAFIESLAQSLVVRTGDERNMLLYFIFFYLLVCANVLIFSFVVHFILRAIWIGLVGLNSVFPEGINDENNMYAPHFMERLRKDFPHNNLSIRELDSLCSIIFAFSAYFVLVILAIALDIGILYLLKLGLDRIIPESFANFILGSFFVLLFIGVMSNLVFNNKKFREKTWVKKWHYPLAKVVSKVVMHMVYRPATYLAYTFMTNINLRQYMGASLIFFLSVLSISMYQLLSGSSVLYLIKKEPIYRQYERVDKTYPEVYENLRLPNHGKILTATIESDQIDGDFLKVFVPIFKGESPVIDSLCGRWLGNDKLTEDENRQNSRQFWLDCYGKYHQFYVNDSLYQIDLVKHNHRNQGEFGTLTFIPTNNFQPGKNILRVEKIRAKSGAIYRTMNIPFWFSGNDKSNSY